jgi:hypothetical protein
LYLFLCLFPSAFFEGTMSFPELLQYWYEIIDKFYWEGKLREDPDNYFLKSQFNIGIIYPVISFHVLWYNGIYFGEIGMLRLDRPHYFDRTKFEKYWEAEFADIIWMAYFWGFHGFQMLYFAFYWIKIQNPKFGFHYNKYIRQSKPYTEHELATTAVQQVSRHGSWNFRKRGYDYLTWNNWYHKVSKKYDEQFPTQALGSEFILYEPFYDYTAFSFQNKNFRVEEAIKRVHKGPLSDESIARMRKNFSYERILDVMTHEVHHQVLNMVFLPYQNSLSNNPWIMFGKDGFWKYKNKIWKARRLGFERWNHRMAIEPHGGHMCKFINGINQHDWYQDCSIMRTIESHSVFRRLCFDYNIPIDYTFWSPEHSLFKSFRDKESWFFTLGKFNSNWQRGLYGYDDDIFLLSWLMTSPTRRHGTFVGSNPLYRPPDGERANKLCYYRPWMHSQVNLFIDSSIDACVAFDNWLP